MPRNSYVRPLCLAWLGFAQLARLRMVPSSQEGLDLSVDVIGAVGIRFMRRRLCTKLVGPGYMAV